MMCYKDKTFCRFYKTCKKGNVCDRALTEEIGEMANKINLPISQFADKPECYEGVE